MSLTRAPMRSGPTPATVIVGAPPPSTQVAPPAVPAAAVVSAASAFAGQAGRTSVARTGGRSGSDRMRPLRAAARAGEGWREGGAHRRAGDLPDPRPDAAPADVGKSRERSSLLVATAIRVVHEERTSAEVLSRDEPPVAAVLGFVAAVTEHEVMTRGNDERSPVAEGRARQRRRKARRLQLVGALPLERWMIVVRITGRPGRRRGVLALLHPIHIEQVVAHVERVAGE